MENPFIVGFGSGIIPKPTLFTKNTPTVTEENENSTNISDLRLQIKKTGWDTQLNASLLLKYLGRDENEVLKVLNMTGIYTLRHIIIRRSDIETLDLDEFHIANLLRLYMELDYISENIQKEFVGGRLKEDHGMIDRFKYKINQFIDNRVMRDSSSWIACQSLSSLLKDRRVWIWVDRNRGIKFHGVILYSGVNIQEYAQISCQSSSAMIRPMTKDNFESIFAKVKFDLVSTDVDQETYDQSWDGQGIVRDIQSQSWCYVDRISAEYQKYLSATVSSNFEHGIQYSGGLNTTSNWNNGCEIFVPLTGKGIDKRNTLHIPNFGYKNKEIPILAKRAGKAFIQLLESCTMFETNYHGLSSSHGDSDWSYDDVGKWKPKPSGTQARFRDSTYIDLVPRSLEANDIKNMKEQKFYLVPPIKLNYVGRYDEEIKEIRTEFEKECHSLPQWWSSNVTESMLETNGMFSADRAKKILRCLRYYGVINLAEFMRMDLTTIPQLVWKYQKHVNITTENLFTNSEWYILKLIVEHLVIIKCNQMKKMKEELEKQTKGWKEWKNVFQDDTCNLLSICSAFSEDGAVSVMGNLQELGVNTLFDFVHMDTKKKPEHVNTGSVFKNDEWAKLRQVVSICMQFYTEETVKSPAVVAITKHIMPAYNKYLV